MNRFSSDTATADDSLPFIANILLANAASLLGVLAVLAYSQPVILLLLLPLATVYYFLQVGKLLAAVTAELVVKAEGMQSRCK